jgi:hypothetical protein
MPETSGAPHAWRFFRAGGLDQVILDRPEDLLHLDQLDLKLWVALACPTRGLEFDPHVLDLIDTDRDGRIRPPEIISAVSWSAARLKSLSSLLASQTALTLADIDSSRDEGKRIQASATRILQNLKKPDAISISTADTTDTRKILVETLLNGDGVVPSAAARTPFVAGVIDDIIATVGSVEDRSGKPGISKAQVDTFFAETEAYLEWCRMGDRLRLEGIEDPEAVHRGYAALVAVQSKLDEHFARLRLAAFEPRVVSALNRSDAEYAALAAKDLVAAAAEVTALPLQRVEPVAFVTLNERINPAWRGLVEAFQTHVVAPLMGSTKATLTDVEWETLKSRFAAVAAWSQDRKGTVVEKLGRARCEAILAADARRDLEQLIADDLALAPEFEAIADVDRLVHYHRHLFRLLANFVNFAGFYDRRTGGIFQSGTLYLDQRSCELCLRVEDPGAHAAFGSGSRMFVAYCDCKRPSGEKMSIAAAVTQGDSDYLTTGRNGVFYDRQGRDWDATVVKVIENPIGLRQAFWSPYRKVAALIEEQIGKFAASRDKASQDAAAAKVGAAAHDAQAGKVEEKKEAFDVAKFAGIFAAIGLAIGAIGGALGAMLSAFASLAWWQMPLAVGGIMLTISGPSVLIAGLKLRLRTLGPLLEGNGWAINGRIGINIPLGTALTSERRFPAGSKLSLADPFEDKRGPRRRRIAWAILILSALLAAWGAIHARRSESGASAAASGK